MTDLQSTPHIPEDRLRHKRRYNGRMQQIEAPIKRLARPELPPPFRITARDIDILRVISQFRFLSSQQVQRIVGGSERGVRNRLRSSTRR